MSSRARCSRCHEEKDTSAFYSNSTTTNGLQSMCKPCSRAYHRERYARLHSGEPILKVAEMSDDEFWGQVDQTQQLRRMPI